MQIKSVEAKNMISLQKQDLDEAGKIIDLRYQNNNKNVLPNELLHKDNFRSDSLFEAY